MRSVLPSEKTVQQIAEEWDRLAETRGRQIRSGLDDSLSNVLAPTVVQLLQDTDTDRIIDIGCGTGWLTEKIAQMAGSVVGIDMSRCSLEIAMRDSSVSNVEYIHSEFEYFSKTHQRSFTVGVANMTMLTVINLDCFVQAVARVLKDGGHLVLTIAHPCYWPLYWQYADCSWFNYLDEILIETPFKIASECTDIATTHVHRPLQNYVDTLHNSGFIIERFVELVGKGFHLPRFLAVKSYKT